MEVSQKHWRSTFRQVMALWSHVHAPMQHGSPRLHAICPEVQGSPAVG
jgi:hypothetical protein